MKLLFQDAKPARTGRCLRPAHDDGKPSLTIGVGKNHRVLVHCFAGCKPAEVMKSIGRTVRDLAPAVSIVVARCAYQDEAGATVFEVERRVPKDFRQRKPDGRGGWVYRTADVRRVLYRLPVLLDAAPTDSVFVVKGEKDVDRLPALGLVASCNAGGAGKWRDEYADHLRGRNVVVVADNDEPGRKHARVV